MDIAINTYIFYCDCSLKRIIVKCLFYHNGAGIRIIFLFYKLICGCGYVFVDID